MNVGVTIQMTAASSCTLVGEKAVHRIMSGLGCGGDWVGWEEQENLSSSHTHLSLSPPCPYTFCRTPK